MILKNSEKKLRGRINKIHKINTKKHLLKQIILKEKEEERLFLLLKVDGLLTKMKQQILYKSQEKTMIQELKRKNTSTKLKIKL